MTPDDTLLKWALEYFDPIYQAKTATGFPKGDYKRYVVKAERKGKSPDQALETLIDALYCIISDEHPAEEKPDARDWVLLFRSPKLEYGHLGMVIDVPEKIYHLGPFALVQPRGSGEIELTVEVLFQELIPK
jgi:hypothetical protein